MTSIKAQDKRLKRFLKKGGRKGAKEDFFKLLKKASTAGSFSKKT